MKNFKQKKTVKRNLLSFAGLMVFYVPVAKRRDCYDLPKRYLYQCNGCGYRISITSGAVMQGTGAFFLKRLK